MKQVSLSLHESQGNKTAPTSATRQRYCAMLVMLGLLCSCYTITPAPGMTREDAKRVIHSFLLRTFSLRDELLLQQSWNAEEVDLNLRRAIKVTDASMSWPRFVLRDRDSRRVVGRFSFDFDVEYHEFQFSRLGEFRFAYHWVNALTPFCLFIIGPLCRRLSYEGGDALPQSLLVQMYGASEIPYVLFPIWLTGAPIWRHSPTEEFCEALAVMKHGPIPTSDALQ